MRGRILGAGAACDAGKGAPVVGDDGKVGKFGMGVPAVTKERCLSRMAPSEPPEIGWGAGCHGRAAFGEKVSNKVSGLEA